MGIIALFILGIVCINFMNLSTARSSNRAKEVGVLLSKEFGKLILIAFVISVPIAWFSVDWWLKGYVYKTEIGVIVYAIAGISALFIARFTMGFQSIKAARSNPIDALKNE